MSLNTDTMMNVVPAGYNSGNGNSGMWGGDWFAWIVLLALLGGFGGRGFGFGGGQGGPACATQADLAAGFNNSSVLSALDSIELAQANAINYNNQGFAGLNTQLLQGFHGVDNAVCTLGYQTQTGFNQIGSQLAQCCCDIQRDIDHNTTQGVMNTNAIQGQIASCCCDVEKMNMQNRFDAQTYNCNTLQAIDKLGDRIIGYMNDQNTQNLRDELQTYRLAASQANQNNYLINALRPTPVPAYQVANPYCCQPVQTCGCNQGYGFGG